ncbi:MAG: hypothetical protein WCF78_01705 [archaeon]
MNEKDIYKLKKSKTVRLSDSAVKNINYMVNETKISESELLRSIIEKAITEYRLKKALDAMRHTNISTSGGARIAGLSYRAFFEKVVESGVLSEPDEVNVVDDNFDINKHIDDFLKMMDNVCVVIPEKKNKQNSEDYNIGGGLDKVHKSIKKSKDLKIKKIK